MERALSHRQGCRVVRPHPLPVSWLLFGWLALIVFSWGLIALPFLVWGWQGFWAYIGLAGLCALLLRHHRSHRKA